MKLIANSVCWMFYNSPEQQDTGDRVPQARILQDDQFRGWDAPQPNDCKSPMCAVFSYFWSIVKASEANRTLKQTLTLGSSSLGRNRNLECLSTLGHLWVVATGSGRLRICQGKRAQGRGPIHHVRHSHSSLRQVSRSARVPSMSHH